MNISDVSSVAVSQSAKQGDPVAINLQRKTQEIAKDTAASLIESVPTPDPASPVGHNLNVVA